MSTIATDFPNNPRTKIPRSPGTTRDVLPDNLDMVDFVAQCSIHAIKIGFQKYYILPGKCCP